MGKALFWANFGLRPPLRVKTPLAPPDQNSGSAPVDTPRLMVAELLQNKNTSTCFIHGQYSVWLFAEGILSTAQNKNTPDFNKLHGHWPEGSKLKEKHVRLQDLYPGIVFSVAAQGNNVYAAVEVIADPAVIFAAVACWLRDSSAEGLFWTPLYRGTKGPVLFCARQYFGQWLLHEAVQASFPVGVGVWSRLRLKQSPSSLD